MTLAEFVLAFDGYLEAKGVKKQTLMGRNELLDLMDKDRAREQRKKK